MKLLLSLLLLQSLILTNDLITFDQNRAFSYLEVQCSFGPRVPGSKAHIQGKDHIVNTIQSSADSVIEQSFMHSFVYTGELIKLTNIVAQFNPEMDNRIWIAAHWDSRPWADLDKDISKRNIPILGANDGASGVAVLLEIANQLKVKSPKIGVDLIFIDGEDIGKSGELEHYFVGSRYLSRNIPTKFPKYCILIDMIGDKNLEIPIEGFSYQQAPKLVNLIWSQAEKMGFTVFKNEISSYVQDDHVILYNIGGIPSIDIIDFDYQYWHTLEDTPDKCSPESLGIIGKLLLNHIYLINSK